jgi:hypothetical protein
VKGLDVGTDRLRVVQCGGDKVVEVDGLDVERLTHMGAAVAQNLHNFVLILNLIEVRLDGLWLSYHLAERERGGKNLDEYRVHAATHQSKGHPDAKPRRQATGPIVPLSPDFGGRLPLTQIKFLRFCVGYGSRRFHGGTIHWSKQLYAGIES